jgi:hypothetical protein
VSGEPTRDVDATLPIRKIVDEIPLEVQAVVKWATVARETYTYRDGTKKSVSTLVVRVAFVPATADLTTYDPESAVFLALQEGKQHGPGASYDVYHFQTLRAPWPHNE